MTDQTKRMPVAEFRAKGYLHELNRLFLHRVGLALEVIIDDDGTEKFGGVWDYRADDEGILYAGEPEQDKIKSISAEIVSRRVVRAEMECCDDDGIQISAAKPGPEQAEAYHG